MYMYIHIFKLNINCCLITIIHAFPPETCNHISIL